MENIQHSLSLWLFNIQPFIPLYSKSFKQQKQQSSAHYQHNAAFPGTKENTFTVSYIELDSHCTYPRVSNDDYPYIYHFNLIFLTNDYY